jgi:excisionase family DNA binding protein
VSKPEQKFWPPVMGTRQASEYLGISTKTLMRWVQIRIMPCYRMGGRWFFRRTEMDACLEKHRVNPLAAR